MHELCRMSHETQLQTSKRELILLAADRDGQLGLVYLRKGCPMAINDMHDWIQHSDINIDIRTKKDCQKPCNI